MAEPWKAAFDDGVALYKNGDYSASLEKLSEAVKQGANGANVFSLRATVLFEHLWKVKEALKDAKMVIKLAPDSPQGYFKSAQIFARMKSTTSALVMVEQALNRTSSRNPKHASLRDTLQSLETNLKAVLNEENKQASAKKCHIVILPVELLTYVFDVTSRLEPSEPTAEQVGRPSLTGRDYKALLPLSEVCRHWRALLLGTPFFWRSLSLTSVRPQRKLRLWAQRSMGSLDELLLHGSIHLHEVDELLQVLQQLYPSSPPSIIRLEWPIQPTDVLVRLANLYGDRWNPTHIDFVTVKPTSFDYDASEYPLRVFTARSAAVNMKRIPSGTIRQLTLVDYVTSGLSARDMMDWIQDNTQLQSLVLVPSVMACNMGPTPELEQWPTYPSLTHLCLSCVDAALFDFFCKIQLQALTYLELKLTRAACKFLRSLPAGTRLKTLRLQSCPCEPEDLTKSLTRLGSELESLSITQIGLDIGPLLAALAGETRTGHPADVICPKVSRFDFSYTTGVSGAPLKRLVKSRTIPADAVDDEARARPTPILSLTVDGCSAIEPVLLPWLRQQIPRVSCIYETKKEIKKFRR